jgi:hypothetical protein
LLEYKNIQVWFTEAQYKEGTKKTYLQYIAMFCGLLGKNPDQLANVTPEEALNIQQRLATAMKEELGLRELSVVQRITALHVFWNCNGVQLTEDIKKYKGTPWLRRKKRVE